LDVIAIDKLRIPRDCDPTPTLDKLLALFICLEDNKLIYMEVIHAMTLLAKLPLRIEEIAWSYNQKSLDIHTLSFAAIHNDVILNWQQHSSKAKQRTPQQSFKVKNYQMFSTRARTLSSSSSNMRCRTKDPKGHKENEAVSIGINRNSMGNTSLICTPHKLPPLLCLHCP